MASRVALDGPIIRVHLTGTISGPDLMVVANEVGEIEASLGKAPHRLVDLSEMVATGMMFDLIMKVARLRREQVFPNSFRSALVAPTPETVGFARMFQILNTNPQIDLRIFDSLGEAEAWLSSPDC